jgi:predicted GTPase
MKEVTDGYVQSQKNENFPSFPKIKDYKKTLIDLTYDLSQLRNFCQKLQLDDSIKFIDNVLSKTQNKSFKIAIIGDYRRGKTTLINVLLGKAILFSNMNGSS